MRKKHVPVPYDKQIEKIMSEFNWELLADRMKLMNWRWARVKGIPNISQLKQCATELLNDVKGRNNHTVSTGGFSASCRRNYLTLRFVVCEAYGYETI